MENKAVKTAWGPMFQVAPNNRFLRDKGSFATQLFISFCPLF